MRTAEGGEAFELFNYGRRVEKGEHFYTSGCFLLLYHFN
jgi:hypothetical protein